MNLADIERLFAYDAWANALMFDCIESLTDEQYTRPLDSSFPNIRETLAHIVGVEWIWNRRLDGESPTEIPSWMRQASTATLRAKLGEVAEERLRLLAGRKDLDAPITYRGLDGKAFTQSLGDILQHVVNHGTYHRGQLTTMIRQVGGTPPRTDYLVFSRSFGSM